jgi:hypothetical protein
MKTWLKPLTLNLALLFLCSVAQADKYVWQDGVVVQKIGPEYMFVFPAVYGRLPPVFQSPSNPSGKIQVGSTITIAYALKLSKGNARFIALDASKLPAKALNRLNPNLKVENNEQVAFGFLVKDTSQPNLNVHINPKFGASMSKEVANQRIGNEGNLNVVIGQNAKVRFYVVKVEVN